jgi:hypothetical protein
MTALYNPSLVDFVGLDAADRAILEEIVSKSAELTMPEPLEEFDHWLDRLAMDKQIVIVGPNERDARKLHAARLAELAGTPMIRRVAVPEAAPSARFATVAEYLAEKGETRDAAEARIRERFGQPGQDRHYDKSVTGDGRPVEVGPPGHPSRGHMR